MDIMFALMLFYSVFLLFLQRSADQISAELDARLDEKLDEKEEEEKNAQAAFTETLRMKLNLLEEFNNNSPAQPSSPKMSGDHKELDVEKRDDDPYEHFVLKLTLISERLV